MPAGPVVREAPYCATDAAGRKAGLHSRRAGRQPPPVYWNIMLTDSLR